MIFDTKAFNVQISRDFMQKCTDKTDFRMWQCKQKNLEMFNDKFFEWEWRPSNLSKKPIAKYILRDPCPASRKYPGFQCY